MTLTFDLLTSKSIGHILDSWWVSVWSFMIIGWLQSQLSSGNHFQITMRHDLDLWPFDLKINRAHPWLMVSKCMKFHPWLMVSKCMIMIIGWLQSQLSSGNHFQITMRHDLDLWPFDPKINRAHPWLMGSKCMKFHDHRWITESVIVRKLVWRTDRLTDRLTDRQRQTECKPIVPSGFTGGGLITMRHDLDLWPFDPKINRAHPWLMGSKCMKFHDHRWITESVIVRKPLVWRTDRQTSVWQTDWVIVKKLVWRTDGRTDRRTDRVQTYSPLRFHRWGTN